MAVTIDGSAGVTTNAGGSVNPSTNVEGINYSCRAWVNFNGTGTVAIRGSGNVTSITDNGTGDYTVNFTTAMSDANYAVSISIFPTSSAAERPELVTLLAASVRVVNDDGANTKIDTSTFTVGIFR
jgi:hypothetical protein